MQVCPTGIDIRNGPAVRVHRLRGLHRRLQWRDGQDGYPRGLIRYDTRTASPSTCRPGSVGAACSGPRADLRQHAGADFAALVASLALRHSVPADVVRDRATLARQVEDG